MYTATIMIILTQENVQFSGTNKFFVSLKINYNSSNLALCIWFASVRVCKHSGILLGLRDGEVHRTNAHGASLDAVVDDADDRRLAGVYAFR